MTSMRADLCSSCVFGCLCRGHQFWMGAGWGAREKWGEMVKLFTLEDTFQVLEPKTVS